MTWNDQFLELYRRCLKNYQDGNHDFKSYYHKADLAFLDSIGYKPRELFDFVEDFADEGVPSESTALLVASVRRDYFLVVQKGVASKNLVTRNDIPGFQESFDGISYLPRITAKAMAKLKGELDPDLMFGCGGDRGFLRTHGQINPADFLRHAWSADGDLEKLALLVKGQD